MTRSSLFSLALALSTLFLTACSSISSIYGPKEEPIPQSKAVPPVSFKVHPGLLGEPVPPELQRTTTPVANETVAGEQAFQADSEGLYVQRSVYFGFDNAEIEADYIPIIRNHARNLASNPGAKVRVEGHADERGNARYNEVLGLRRAEAVKKVLLTNGAHEKQVKAISYGDTRPKLKGRDEASWAENRRADIVYEEKE